MGRYHSLDFYVMGDVFADAFSTYAATAGVEPSDDELAELIDLMWEANLQAVRPMDGAIKTFDALRASSGVGVVSWADEGVFDRLIEQLGFGDHVDVAAVSETARSCKPHPGIFQYALDALSVPGSGNVRRRLHRAGHRRRQPARHDHVPASTPPDTRPTSARSVTTRSRSPTTGPAP